MSKEVKICHKYIDNDFYLTVNHKTVFHSFIDCVYPIIPLHTSYKSELLEYVYNLYKKEVDIKKLRLLKISFDYMVNS